MGKLTLLMFVCFWGFVLQANTPPERPCHLYLAGEISLENLLNVERLSILRGFVAQQIKKDFESFRWIESLMEKFGRDFEVAHAASPSDLSPDQKAQLALGIARRQLEGRITRSILQAKEPVEFLNHYFGGNTEANIEIIESVAEALSHQLGLEQYLLEYLDATIKILSEAKPPALSELPFVLADLRQDLIRKSEKRFPPLQKYGYKLRNGGLLKERIELLQTSDRVPDFMRGFFRLQEHVAFGLAGQVSWPTTYLEYINIAQYFLRR